MNPLDTEITISREHGLRYPAPDALNPPEAYPEYPFKTERTLSPNNQVYPLVRRCLREMGGDPENYGTPRWNPLGKYIGRGQRVFLLPNFVTHARADESPAGMQSKCTHASVIRAMLDYAVIAAGDPSLVSFGNAPIQACNFERVTRETGAEAIHEFYRTHGHPGVGPHDLRMVVSKFAYGAMTDKRVKNIDDGVRVDIGQDSLLEAHYARKDRVEFRIGDYPAEEIMAYHGPGRHEYVVNRRLLEADTIISIPKLKTHERVGITCALKGTVGTIGFKECLAHHRLGGPDRGGDEYPHPSLLRDFASKLVDRADAGGTGVADNTIRIASKVLQRALRTGPSGIMLGMWHGNDTCWRMSLDIARVLRFADRQGNLRSVPQRRHIALIDGIVGGEGAGPLKSTPHPTGAVLFGADIALLDAACAFTMGLDPNRIPLVARAFGLEHYPITEHPIDALRVRLDGRPLRSDDLPLRFFPPFKLPKGWVGHVELPSARAPVWEDAPLPQP